ncbi:MAG: hypothetical protein NTW33_06235, partial [Methanoregula sp.]|nr:hypothetical protein [Methanoregula sp.]
AGDLHVDIFQVVLACTFDDDIFHSFCAVIICGGLYRDLFHGMPLIRTFVIPAAYLPRHYLFTCLQY